LPAIALATAGLFAANTISHLSPSSLGVRPFMLESSDLRDGAL
jgi:hypothetical protein